MQLEISGGFFDDGQLACLMPVDVLIDKLRTDSLKTFERTFHLVAAHFTDMGKDASDRDMVFKAAYVSNEHFEHARSRFNDHNHG